MTREQEAKQVMGRRYEHNAFPGGVFTVTGASGTTATLEGTVRHAHVVLTAHVDDLAGGYGGDWRDVTDGEEARAA